MVTFDASLDTVSKPQIHRRIEALILLLRRRKLIGSKIVAIEVLKLIKDIVAGAKFNSFPQLVKYIAVVGEALQDAGPKEFVITNMYKRVIHALREEYVTALSNHFEESSSTAHSPDSLSTPVETPQRTDSPSCSVLGSMFDLLGHKELPSFSNTPSHTPHAVQTPPGVSVKPKSMSMNVLSPQVARIMEDEFSKRCWGLKPVFIEAIQELMEEVEMTDKNVSDQSLDHIHPGEFIMTIGYSKTVESFLKAAARKRKFTVIVAETAPFFTGHQTARSLSSSGIPTILIPDSNIFALLPRCSKVLLGPHIITADGTILAISGSYPLCVAAQSMRVPVVVCAGMFKFSRVHLNEVEWSVRDLGTPGLVGFEKEGVDVLCPYYDIVPSELLSLYITNLGSHPSSVLYRLLADNYGPA